MRLPVLSSLLLAALPVAADFDPVVDLSTLDRPRNWIVEQVSSHDPTGGNEDSGHYVRTQGDRWVLADLKGPGEIVRLWSANPSGQLQVFFDGEDRPRIDCPFENLFMNQAPPFAPPLATRTSGGWISYFPIPYAQACRVEVVHAKKFYYQVTYATHPAGTAIESYRAGLTPDRRAALARAQRELTDPAGLARVAVLEGAQEAVVPAGGRLTLAERAGAGRIAELLLKVESPDRFALRRLAIEASWDGAAELCVRVPLADFFGQGFGAGPIETLPVGQLPDGTYYCRFPMPFSNGAKLSLVSESPAEAKAAWKVTAEALPKAEADGRLRFHAQWRRAVTKVGAPHLLLETEGRGHYVGTVLTMQGGGGLGFLEGDEIVRVDDRAEPVFIGTGTEDYFNSGWYFATGEYTAGTHALTVKDEGASRISVCRFHLADAIPFTKRIRFEIEHGGVNDAPNSDYASAAFWYQTEPHAPVAALPPGDQRVWQAPRRGGWWEAEDLIASGPEAGRAAVEASEQSGLDWHGGRQVALRGNKGEGLEFEIRVPDADRYTVAFRHTRGPKYVSFVVKLGGQELGGVDARAEGPAVAEAPALGTAFLKPGTARLRFELAQEGRVGIDAVRLVPRSIVDRWMVVGPFDNKGDKGFDRVYPPEEKVDLAAQYDVVGGKKAGWREARTDAKEEGMVLFRNWIGQKDDVVAYAVSYIAAPEAVEVPFYAGSDDGIKVWLNGAPVHSNHAHRASAPHQDEGTLKLRKGWNELLVKIDQGNGGWGFIFQVPDPEGKLKFGARPE